MKDEFRLWSKHFRENFDKLLLMALAAALLALVLHMAHDAQDGGNVSWGRELTGTVLGALLGLITGQSMRASKPPTNGTHPPEPPQEGH